MANACCQKCGATAGVRTFKPYRWRRRRRLCFRCALRWVEPAISDDAVEGMWDWVYAPVGPAPGRAAENSPPLGP